MGSDKEEKVQEKKDDGYEVLKVFGLKLKVKDPKIADLLTTDVKEDVATFRSKLGASETEESEDADKQHVLPPEEIDSPERFQEEINLLGRRLEFDVGLREIWRSSTGIAVVLKPVFSRLGFESAKEEVDRLAKKLAQIKNEKAGLFITRDAIACDIIKAAIRSTNLYHIMRVVSYENLYELLQLKESGYLKHRQVVTLMVPLSNVDVGELLNIIKAVATPTTLEEYLLRKKS